MPDPASSLLDLQPIQQNFLDDVLEGLQSDPKRLSCKYLYDAKGCDLFDQICELDEYYLTRTELSIMDEHASEMAQRVGRDAMVIEFGSGSSIKTRLLLDEIDDLSAYVPVDIARSHLLQASQRLSDRYPEFEILPVCADFCQPLRLPEPERPVSRRVVYFPGSTIGNFERAEAAALLEGIAELCGPGGGLLIGIDLQKDTELLEAAYDDREGVTAEFNRNLLAHINRELDADFRLSNFDHRAVFDRAQSRIEMHLVSKTDHAVRLNGQTIEFSEGESICTEHSHKYDPAAFVEWHGLDILEQKCCWTDERGYFAILYLEVRAV